MIDNEKTKKNLREKKLDKNNDKFYQYYEQKSADKETLNRFTKIKYNVEKYIKSQAKSVTVADIGCGAGVQSILWAKSGYKVRGIDINQNLIDLAAKNASNSGLDIEFLCGSATDLPWQDSSIDVCLVPELLEHVPFWHECLEEFARILKPGGILFLSTNNKLCPKQQEFELPLYSWYPRRLKRHYEKLAVTTRPELVSYAQFPAVNWFSYYGLRKELRHLGFEKSYDRFDVGLIKTSSSLSRVLLKIITTIFLFRWLAHVFTPYTMVIAIKEKD